MPAARGPRKIVADMPVGRVTFVRSGKWWAAELPAFPGAYSQGRTRAEAYRMLLSALRDLMDVYAETAPKRIGAA